jgi:hypothetical protein
MHNLQNLNALDFEIVTLGAGADTWRLAMRAGFLRYGNWAKSTELALYSGAPRVAIAEKIPVILWGENLALQWGDMNALGSTGYDGNRVRFLNTLAGGELEWLREADIPPHKLLPYTYPAPTEYELNGLQTFFLGWALGDWSEINNGIRAGLTGLKFREESGSLVGDPFGTASLDEDFVVVNQMIKYYKFGFGRMTEYVNEMIRNGQLDREQGIALLRVH